MFGSSSYKPYHSGSDKDIEIEVKYEDTKRECEQREENSTRQEHKVVPAIRPNQLPVIPCVHTGQGRLGL